MNNRYQTIDDVYYGTSDTKFHEFVEFYNANPNQFRFVGISGGLAALNFIALLKPVSITLCDLNPYSLMYAKLILRLIEESHDSADLFARMASKNYKVKTKEEEYFRDILYFMGVSKPKSGPNWTVDIPGAVTGHYQNQPKRGIQLRHPLASWDYALQNFNDLKACLANTPIEFLEINCLTSKFNDLIDQDNTWTWLSNVDCIGFKKKMFTRLEYQFSKSNYCVLTTEIKGRLYEVKNKPCRIVKVCNDTVYGTGDWAEYGLIKML